MFIIFATVSIVGRTLKPTDQTLPPAVPSAVLHKPTSALTDRPALAEQPGTRQCLVNILQHLRVEKWKFPLTVVRLTLREDLTPSRIRMGESAIRDELFLQLNIRQIQLTQTNQNNYRRQYDETPQI